MESVNAASDARCVRCDLIRDYKSETSSAKIADDIPRHYKCHTCHDLSAEFFALLNGAFKTKKADDATYKCIEFRSSYGYEPNEIVLEQLVESTTKGCASCTLLCGGLALTLKDFLEEWPRAGDRIALEFSSRFAVGLYLTSRDDWDGWSGWFDGFELYTEPGSGCPWPALVVNNHVPEQLELDYCLAKIQNLIRCCEQAHVHPSKEPQQFELPKRVLDLQPSDNQQYIALVETEGLTDRYITLSHSWGQSQLLRTTTVNLVDHKNGIDYSRLSKTFQDAIALTKGLGIRYLWIDSLCIIQDDEKDWQVESANMGAVYSNSYLTIAATRTSSGNGGLFSSRWREYVLTIGREKEMVSRVGIGPKEITTGADKPFQIYVRPSLSTCHDDLYPRLHKFPSIRSAPLLSRGWCLQERLLSPRTVHFHSAEMFFECGEYQVCECGLPEGSGQYQKSGPRLLRLQEVPVEKSWELWLKICGNYASLNLTKAHDKLPALAGLASVFAEKFGWQRSDYLAGLWRPHLPEALLWYVMGFSAPNVKRATPFLAPTWSWASLKSTPLYDEALHFLSYTGDVFEHDRRYKTLNTHCTVKGENPFGEVYEARIKVFGAYVQPRYVVPGRRQSIHTYELYFNEDGLREEDGADFLVLHSDLVLQDLFMQRWRPFPLYCLLIGMGWGLVLRPSRTIHSTYERVGVFNGGNMASKFENAEEAGFTLV